MASNALNAETPVAGLYETLITRRLEERMKQLDAAGWRAIDEVVGAGSTPHVLSRHIANTVRQVLQGLDPAEQVVAANHILESIKTVKGATEWSMWSSTDRVNCWQSPSRKLQASTPYARPHPFPTPPYHQRTRGPEPRLRAPGGTGHSGPRGPSLRVREVARPPCDRAGSRLRPGPSRPDQGAHDDLHRRNRAPRPRPSGPRIRRRGEGELRAPLDSPACQGLALPP